MNKLAKSVVDFFLFTNIFIGICAAAQGLLTYKLIGAQPSYLVLALLFFSTVCVYNFSILLAKPSKPELSPFRRVRWIFTHYRLVLIITGTSAVILIPIFFVIPLSSEVLLFFLALAAFGYGLPIFTKNQQKFGLRNIPGIKLFLIAMVWSASCVLLPVLEAESSQSSDISAGNICLLILRRFLFVAAITIPFDIRDRQADQQANLKTIPVLWGEQKAYTLCWVIVACYVMLLMIFDNGFDVQFWSLALSILVTTWLIFNRSFKKNEYYYFLYLDGTMLLQLIILICGETIGNSVFVR